MIASTLVDVLLEIGRTLGTLPERIVVQADNTPKETKNTICLYAAVFIMCHIRHTPLQTMEFTYLIPGHTHDIIDAIFALVSKALHGRNFHSLPEMMQILSAHMSRPPAWKHLRDYWDFKKSSAQAFHIRSYTWRDSSASFPSLLVTSRPPLHPSQEVAHGQGLGGTYRNGASHRHPIVLERHATAH